MWKVAVAHAGFYLAFVKEGRTTKTMWEDFGSFQAAQNKADRLNH